MKIETTPREDHQATMTVEVELEKLEGARHRAARKISEKAKIPGFRPGKAPYDVVRRMYGDSAITEEAVEILVNDIYPLALKESGLEPAAMGQLENVESLDPPKFIFTIPLSPTVELGDYKSVRLPYEWIAPDDEKLEDSITDLRRMYSATESVDRAAAEGDYLMVDVLGVKAKAEDGEAPLIERTGFATLIRKEAKEDEWPFPGFAAKLAGTKPGEDASFSHKFAKDDANEALQGQNVKFTVKVKTVRGVNMPELDDTFAMKTGLGTTVEDLRVRMRENLEAESRAEYDDSYFESVIDQIKLGATIKYPPQVLEHEVEHVLGDIQSRLQSQGIENLEAYYKLVDSTAEKFLEEQARPTAKRRLERGLILDEIVRAEGIKFEEDELEMEFQQAWGNLIQTDPDFNKRTKGGTKPTREIVDAVAMNSANRLMVRLALQKIKAIATGEATDAAPAEEKAASPKKSKKAKAAISEEAPVEAVDAAEGSEESAKPAKKKAAAKKKSE